MNIVLDTNVLVSGLLSPHGPPAQIVGWVAAGHFRLGLTSSILAEYREVLARPHFAFDPEALADLLAQIEADGCVATPAPVAAALPDPDDEPFLACALALRSDHLVTGNLRHFPAKARRNVSLITPRQLVEIMREGGFDVAPLASYPVATHHTASP